eukprot:gene13236-28001_t
MKRFNYLSILVLSFPQCLVSYLYLPSCRGPSPMWHDNIMVEHSKNIIKSFYDLTGEELLSVEESMSNPQKCAKDLFFLPNRVVVSCGTQTDGLGPILNYGNSEALKLWNASWEQLTSMPGSYTAEADLRDDRQKLLDDVRINGFSKGYSGVRISLDKRRFRIINGIVWNIIIDGLYLGQAATFDNWELLETNQ